MSVRKEDPITWEDFGDLLLSSGNRIARDLALALGDKKNTPLVASKTAQLELLKELLQAVNERMGNG